MTIQVEGLWDLQKELRALDKSWPRELAKANKAVADIVAKGARSKASSLGGVAAKAAPSIKPLGQQRKAQVKLGGTRYPYALGAEFGGGRHGKGNPTARGGYTTQFGSFTKRGRFLFPTIEAKRTQVIEEYGDSVKRLTKQAFPH